MHLFSAYSTEKLSVINIGFSTFSSLFHLQIMVSTDADKLPTSEELLFFLNFQSREKFSTKLTDTTNTTISINLFSENERVVKQMKIICDTAAMNEAASNVQRAVASKAVNPALEGIYIKPTGQGVELCGFDTDVGITTLISADSAEGGGTVINAKTFCDIIRHLPARKMSIETDEKNKCVIRSGDAEYTLMGIPENTYPELPFVTGGTPMILPQEILKNMIRQVIFAVSLDDSKTVHKGVKFEIREGEMTLAALDGYRLAVRHEAIDYTGDPISFIAPSKTLSEVVKLINDDEGFVSVNLDKKHIIFGLNGYNIVSGLLEGDFIDYRRTIPQKFETAVIVNTQDMTDSIDRISLLITERFKTPVKCVVDSEQNEIRFLSSNTIGSANDRISADVEGVSIVKGFNSRYLSDAFRAVDTERMRIMLNPAAVDPACIYPIEGDRYFYMILPVRLPDEQAK